jgi:acetolactate synthase-1/2/3 large subunit
MGYSVPAAIGAKIAFPDRMVVSMVGDGGFLMTGQEIATAFHHGVAPIVLVFNNQMYGTIRMHQERAYPGRVSGTGLTNPDFAKFADAFGGHGEVVSDTADFAPAFRRAVVSGAPPSPTCEPERRQSPQPRHGARLHRSIPSRHARPRRGRNGDSRTCPCPEG